MDSNFRFLVARPSNRHRRSDCFLETWSGSVGEPEIRIHLPRTRPSPELSRRTEKPARRFKDFTWQTRKSWSRERRVVAKAEWTAGEANPRFVVTSLAREEHEARHLYEKLYCARGEMENRIKSLPSRKRGSASSTCMLTAPRLIPCAPTNCAFGLPRWPMS